MNKTQAGRLLTLALYLKTQLKPVNFDMSEHYNERNDRVDRRCSLGWCAHIWPTRFVLSNGGIDFDGVDVYADEDWLNQFDGRFLRFFGVSHIEAKHLFGWIADTVHLTPKQAARRIEKIVDKRGYTYAYV